MAWSLYGSNNRKYSSLTKKIFAIDMLRALKSSLKHRRKHVLRSLQLYGDQALSNRTIMHQLAFPEFHFETEVKVDFPSACI